MGCDEYTNEGELENFHISEFPVPTRMLFCSLSQNIDLMEQEPLIRSGIVLVEIVDLQINEFPHILIMPPSDPVTIPSFVEWIEITASLCAFTFLSKSSSKNL